MISTLYLNDGTKETLAQNWNTKTYLGGQFSGKTAEAEYLFSLSYPRSCILQTLFLVM